MVERAEDAGDQCCVLVPIYGLVGLPALRLGRQLHNYACLDRHRLLGWLHEAKFAAVVGRGRRGTVELHDLGTLARYRVVCQSLPFKTGFRKGCLKVWVRLDLTCGISLVVELKSNVLTVDILPNEFHDLINGSLNFANINRRQMSNIRPIFSLCCMIDIDQGNSECFLSACSRQLQEMSFISFILIFHQQLIVVERKQHFILYFVVHVILHKRPELRFTHIERLYYILFERRYILLEI